MASDLTPEVENPRAFPCAIAVSASGDEYHGLDGMTLRDWFAGQAVIGMMAGGTIPPAAHCAAAAYVVADAMLAERRQASSETPS